MPKARPNAAPPELPARSPPWHAVLTLLVWGGVGALALALTLQQVDDVDFWWQLATGRHIVEHGIPRHDVLTYTRAGTPRVESSWLYCVLLYLGYARIGIESLVLAKSALVLATFGLTLRAARPTGPLESPLLAGLVALALLASSGRFVMRPEVISYAFFAVFVAVLSGCRTGRERTLWILPPLTALWANLHSLFPLGPVVVALWLAAGVSELLGARLAGAPADPAVRRRVVTGSALLALCAAACLANPFGYRLIAVPFDQFAGLHAWAPGRLAGAIALLGALTAGAAALAWVIGPRLVQGLAGRVLVRGRRASIALGLGAALCLLGPAALSAVAAAQPVRGAVSSGAEKPFIAELTSPVDAEQNTPSMLYAEILLGAVLLGVALRPRAVGLFALLVCSAALYLGVAATRNAELFALAALVCAARALPASPPALGRGPWSGALRSLSPLVGLAVLALCATQALDAVSGRFQDQRGLTRRVGLGIDDRSVPGDALAFLRATGVAGNVFNTQRAGSFLAWEGVPVFIDSRGVSGVIGEYRAIVEAPTTGPLAEAARRYDIRALLVGAEAASLLGRLRTEPDWRPVFADAAAVVYLRADQRPDLPTLDFGPEWSARARAALAGGVENDRRAWFMRSWIGRVFFARAWYGRTVTPVQFRRAASVCLSQGRFDAAVELLEDSRRAFPPSYADDYALGQAAMGAGAFGVAAAAFDRALRHAPGDGDLLLSRAVALMNSGDLKGASEAALRAAGAAPRSAEARYVCGLVELRRGGAERAAGLLSQAVALDPAQSKYHALLGSALAESGRTAGAVGAFEAAHRLDPSEVAVVTNLALLESSLDHPDRARHWAGLASSMGSSDPRIRRILDAPTPPP